MKTYAGCQYEPRKSQNFLLSFGFLKAVDEPIANTLPPDLENFRLEASRQSVAETIDKTLFIESLEIDTEFGASHSSFFTWWYWLVGVRLAGRQLECR